MIIIEVGANDGQDTKRYLESGATVYAFEPNKNLANLLINIKNDNLTVINKAVSDYNGNSTFFLDELSNQGCSSLREFNDNISHTWPDRSDFKVTNHDSVEVVTLESFIENNNIQNVDYLHIDAQGEDLKVLKGCGKYLNLIKSGVMEAARSNELALYKNQHTMDDCIHFLNDNNFTVINIEDDFSINKNEVNIHFKRNMVD